jgi:hypothetical protein
MAIKERFSKEDKELDELAMDNYSQQGNDTHGLDDSVDEDYAYNVSNEDEENARLRLSCSFTSSNSTLHKFDPFYLMLDHDRRKRISRFNTESFRQSK